MTSLETDHLYNLVTMSLIVMKNKADFMKKGMIKYIIVTCFYKVFIHFRGSN